MDCKTARYLLDFARPRGHDLDAGDRAALDAHLAVCSDCDSVARAERHFDDHLGRAVREVPVPHGLKERLLGKLRQQRDDWWKQALGRGLRYTAAAALVLVAVFAGFSIYKSRLRPLDPEQVSRQLAEVEYAPPSKEKAEDWFRRQRHAAAGPADFNYSYLRSFDLAGLNGELVPHLLFVRPGGHVAEVFIFSEKVWDLSKLSSEMVSPSGDVIKVTIREPSGGYAYAIRFSGDLKLLRTSSDRQSE